MSTSAQRLAAIAELEKLAIPLPAEQHGKPSLAQMIHCALVELADLRAEHDRRVTELLAANTAEVERRRVAEDVLRRLLIVVEQVEHIGLDEDLYQAALSDARAVLHHA